jgi:hydroxypyruvate isomerase
MNDSDLPTAFSRRQFLAGSTAFAAGTLVATAQTSSSAATREIVPSPDYGIANGNIHHSVMGWCFNPMPTEELMDACNAMGMTAMEGINSTFYPRLRELGMNP